MERWCDTKEKEKESQKPHHPPQPRKSFSERGRSFSSSSGHYLEQELERLSTLWVTPYEFTLKNLNRIVW